MSMTLAPRTVMVNQNLEFLDLHFVECCSLLLLVLVTDIQICQELLALCQVLTSVLKIVVAQPLLVTNVLLLSCNIVSVDRTLAVTRKAGITNGVKLWPMNQDNP